MKKRRNKNNRNSNGKYIIVVLMVLLALTVAAGTFAWVWHIRLGQEDRQAADLSEDSSSPEETEQVSTEET